MRQACALCARAKEVIKITHLRENIIALYKAFVNDFSWLGLICLLSSLVLLYTSIKEFSNTLAEYIETMNGDKRK